MYNGHSKNCNGDPQMYMTVNGVGDKLQSISEFDEHQLTRSSIAGLSSYTGYSYATRSPSIDSFSTVTSGASRSVYSRSTLPGDRKINTDNALQQRLRNEEKQKRNYELCKKVRVTIALLGILLLVAAIFMLSFYLPKQYKSNIVISTASVKPREFSVFQKHIIYKLSHPLQMNFSLNTSDLSTPKDVKPKLIAFLGELLSPEAKNSYSKIETNDSISMKFKELDSTLTTLMIKTLNFSEKCFQITWESESSSKLEDCFDINDTHWFGLGEFANQRWPIDKVAFESTPFLTSDYLDTYQPFKFGGILEPLMLNNKGVGIYIDENVPLHVSMNDKNNGKFCIRADYNKYNLLKNNIFLNYTVCVGENIMKVHKVISEKFIKKPSGVPREQVFRKPIWSTWVKFKKEINQTIILSFIDEIVNHGFERSHFQIDDRYQVEYGDFDFDPHKFNRVMYMMNYIKHKGFDITCWVFPFANLQSKTFIKGLEYWVKVGSKKLLGITKWWDGQGAILDTTNELARNWFIKRLKEFQIYQIDGFKFDAGEVNYLPVNYEFTEPQQNPNYYTKNYVKMAAAFSGLSEVRVAYKTQEYPLFLRMVDRSSTWGSINGLQSVLTATLTFGILGYPYVLPDMVGGNAYYQSPNKELYVRWAQLCAFLPAIQFSIPPWDYDLETVAVVKKALEIRKNMSDIIYEAAKNAPVTGEPIVRPLWWYWPEDQETFVIDTEFMLGSDYLIAPILHLNILSHVIYLPQGIWLEQWGERKTLNMTIGGFVQYNVTLQDTCYFQLLSRKTVVEESIH